MEKIWQYHLNYVNMHIHFYFVLFLLLFFFLAYLQDYMIGYIIEAHKEIRFSHLCSANKNQKPA